MSERNTRKTILALISKITCTQLQICGQVCTLSDLTTLLKGCHPFSILSHQPSAMLPTTLLRQELCDNHWYHRWLNPADNQDTTPLTQLFLSQVPVWPRGGTLLNHGTKTEANFASTRKKEKLYITQTTYRSRVLFRRRFSIKLSGVFVMSSWSPGDGCVSHYRSRVVNCVSVRNRLTRSSLHTPTDPATSLAAFVTGTASV